MERLHSRSAWQRNISHTQEGVSRAGPITGTTHCNSRNRTFIQKRRTFIQKRRSTVVFGPLKPTNRFEFRNTRTERRPSPGRGRRRLRCDKVCSSVTIRSWSRRVVLVADLIRSSPLRSARCELTGSDSIGPDASPDGNPACVCADLSHHEFKSFDLGHKPFRPLFYAISVPPPPPPPPPPPALCLRKPRALCLRS